MPPCQLDILRPLWVTMARSKTLHIVQHEVILEQPDDVAVDAFNELVQVDVLLSEKLGRTIRNGTKFRLVGYGTALRGSDSSPDIDTGFAITTGIQYCPVTKASVSAWKGMFGQWKKQKTLANRQGGLVRYDDFECGWNQTIRLPTARNSSVHMTGIGDVNAEEIVIYGTSASGDRVSLEDYYNSLQPVPAASTNPFGSTIKTAKFSNYFPPQVSLYSAATFSSNLDVVTTPDALAGGVAMTELYMFPSDNHVTHLTGTLSVYGKVIPPDTSVQNADQLKCIITLVYEGWSPIIGSKKRLPKRKYTPRSKTYGRKTTRRSKRRY